MLPALPRIRTLAWVGFWLVLIALLFRLDGRIAAWAEGLRLHWFHYGHTPWTLRQALELYGRMIGTVLAAAGILLRDRRSQARAVALVLVTLSVSGAVNVVKGLSGRMRPGPSKEQLEEYKTVFAGPERGFIDPDYRSFPSGHTAAAASNTVVLNTFYPQLAPVTWTLTFVVAGERVFDRKHFPSDTAAAVLIGWVLSQWLLRRSRFQRLCELLARRRRDPGAHAGGEPDP